MNTKYKILTILALLILSATNVAAQDFGKLTDAVEKGKYGNIDAIIIADADSIIYEKYFNGFNADRLHECFSLTKSVTSILYGIAAGEGKLPELDTPVIEFLPEYKKIFIHEASKGKITLRHLLTMTAGLEWNEFGGIPKKLSESDDFVKAVLSLPMASPPGNKFIYNTSVSVLLGVLLEKFTGVSFEDYLRSKLFDKLGIYKYKLDYVTDGIANSGAGLSLKAKDLIKIGQMLLKKGNGILPPEWIKLSTAKHVERGKRSDYGFQWWRYDNAGDIASRLSFNDLFFASGFGGQFLWVIPHWNITIMTFERNFENGKEAHKMFADYFIPAFENN